MSYRKAAIKQWMKRSWSEKGRLVSSSCSRLIVEISKNTYKNIKVSFLKCGICTVDKDLEIKVLCNLLEGPPLQEAEI